MTPPIRTSPPLLLRTSLLAFGVAFIQTAGVAAQSLQGSPASLDRQNHQARAHGFTYIQTPQQLRNFVDNGYLVPVVPNRDFDIHQVSFPYARPEVRLFIERLAAQYRGACGEKLVVTSLTRPISNQPPNASVRSVHPTGMAVDLRRSANARCRQWLEATLLSLEGQGLVEAIYERNPPHYHVAVYPQPYAQHVARLTGESDVVVASAPPAASPPAVSVQAAAAPARPASDVSLASTGSANSASVHIVARGESLWTIARRYGVSEDALRRANGVSGSRILVGQRLTIPGGGTAPSAAPGVEIRHTVARGESLWTIARRYGVTEDVLRALNGIQGSRILVGQTLMVPTGERTNAQYTVQRGDSLWVIANRLGTSVDEIRARNGMSSTRIYAGQVLDVPLGR